MAARQKAEGLPGLLRAAAAAADDDGEGTRPGTDGEVYDEEGSSLGAPEPGGWPEAEFCPAAGKSMSQ